MSNKTIRLSKHLARCGLGSRRECERLIEQKSIKVNGRDVHEVYHVISPKDEVMYMDRVVRVCKERMFLYHKQPGVIVSHKDHRYSVFQDMQQEVDEYLISVGRLDLLSEGLLIMTNSGALAHAWETSKTQRRYEVTTLCGAKDIQRADIWDKYISVDGVKYEPIQLVHHRQIATNIHQITVELTEGKNREIRNIWKSLGWKIRKLIRTHYGQFSLHDLAKRKWKEVELVKP